MVQVVSSAIDDRHVRARLPIVLQKPAVEIRGVIKSRLLNRFAKARIRPRTAAYSRQITLNSWKRVRDGVRLRLTVQYGPVRKTCPQRVRPQQVGEVVGHLG